LTLDYTGSLQFILNQTLLLKIIKLSSNIIMTGSKLIVDSALKAAAHLRSSKLPSEVAKSSAALFSAYGGATHTLPDLKYDYGALERKYLFIVVGC